jgi:hypothetical protein
MGESSCRPVEVLPRYFPKHTITKTLRAASVPSETRAPEPVWNLNPTGTRTLTSRSSRQQQSLYRLRYPDSYERHTTEHNITGQTGCIYKLKHSSIADCLFSRDLDSRITQSSDLSALRPWTWRRHAHLIRRMTVGGPKGVTLYDKPHWTRNSAEIFYAQTRPSLSLELSTIREANSCVATW